MIKIAKIFENDTITINNIKYKTLDIHNEPIVISGLNWLNSNENYCRLPENEFNKLNEFVKNAVYSTAGVNIRFQTNSKTIGLKVIYGEEDDMSHMPRTGASGFDFYLGKGVGKKYVATLSPKAKQNEYENILNFEDNKNKEITINFPLYRAVKDVKLIIEQEAVICHPTPFEIKKPLVFYGSSITQGACASRPGNCYTTILSRWLNANHINLGFSGGALAEPIIANLISEIDMSAFIMDYDYNAPTVQFLEETHENFYNLFRNKCPKIPVIMVTRPNYGMNPIESEARKQVIYNTYIKAFEKGENVYFVDGSRLFGNKDQDSCTVDSCHPNDLGFMRMAENIYPILTTVLLKEGYIL